MGDRISALDAKTTVADTDMFPLVDEEAAPDETKKITGAYMKVAMVADLITRMITPIADYPYRQISFPDPTPFDADIAGSPSATSVVYDGDSNEGCLQDLGSSGVMWGRVVLHNTTRGNSRKIVSVNVATNTITTESSTDDWADNDVITTQSTTNVQAGYCDLDLSAQIPATAEAAVFYSQVNNIGAATGQAIVWHPYSAYNAGKRTSISATLAGDVAQMEHFVQIISQKVTFILTGITDASIIVYCKGYI